MLLQKSFARIAVCLVVVGGLIYFFPLVRIRKLDAANAHQQTASNSRPADSSKDTAVVDNAEFIEVLWRQRIPAAAKQAAYVNEVLALAASDGKAARTQYGRMVGLGGPSFLFLRGRGKVEDLNAEECALSIPGLNQRVVLEIGILVSNAVRDATGLVNVADFPNSQEFNQIAIELNNRCELEVIAPVRAQLAIGSVVEFVGCGEVDDDDGFRTLRLVPLQLKLLGAGESGQ